MFAPAANSSRETMYQAYANASAYVRPDILMVTPYLWKYKEGSTSVTNAWRTSLWHVRVSTSANLSFGLVCPS